MKLFCKKCTYVCKWLQIIGGGVCLHENLLYHSELRSVFSLLSFLTFTLGPDFFSQPAANQFPPDAVRWWRRSCDEWPGNSCWALNINHFIFLSPHSTPPETPIEEWCIMGHGHHVLDRGSHLALIHHLKLIYLPLSTSPHFGLHILYYHKNIIFKHFLGLPSVGSVVLPIVHLFHFNTLPPLSHCLPFHLHFLPPALLTNDGLYLSAKSGARCSQQHDGNIPPGRGCTPRPSCSHSALRPQKSSSFHPNHLSWSFLAELEKWNTASPEES